MSSLGLALSMLWHQKKRTALYITGVLMAAVLLFLQFGFLRSLNNTATQFTDAFDFDIALVSSGYNHFNSPGDFPRERLDQARGLGEVLRTIPLQMGVVRWLSNEKAGRVAELSRDSFITVLATDPLELPALIHTHSEKVFGPGGSPEAARTLATRGNVLMDRASRSEYGHIPDSPKEARWVRVVGILENTEQVRLVGGFSIGTGFAANAVLLSSIETLEVLNGPGSTVSLGLIQLRGGTSVEATMKKLRERLPNDVYLFTRAELAQRETTHWTENVPVGRFFYVGVGVALVVGLLFIYQMMVSDVRKHAAQFATLKALGYSNGYLAGVVLWQGLVLGLLGSIPSVLVAWVLYALIRAWIGLPIFLTGELLLRVLLPTLGLCLGSGLLALRKVYQAAPADLF